MKKSKTKPIHPYLKSLGEELKKLRVKQSLSLESLGSDIGIDASNLQKIELGQNLTIKTILKLCIKLEVTPSKLFDKIAWELSEQDIDKLTTPRTIKRSKKL